MSCEESNPRWITGESIARLSAKLGLPVDPLMQDWDILNADPRRLGEFLDLYETESLTEDDKFALMALIVASFDDWLGDGGTDEAVLTRIQRHLVSEFTQHEATVHYWCLFDEPDPAECFVVTQFMRDVWRRFR